MAGYILMVERDEVLYYSAHRAKREYEPQYVNYALVYGMLEYYREKLESGYYIVDGERNINHITNHQDFLCKKFGFRRAYCKLHLIYRPGIKWIVNLLLLLKPFIKRYDSYPLIHKINGVLTMEEISRQQCK